MATLDPTLFTDNPLNLQEGLATPSAAGQPVGAVQSPELPMQPLNEAMQGTQISQQAQAGREFASRARPSYMESVKAAWQTTDTMRLYRSFKDEDVADSGERIPLSTFLKHTPDVLDPVELEYMREDGDLSAQGYTNRLERIRSIRKAHEVAGEHTSALLLSGLVDPVWLVAGAGIGKLGQLGKISRGTSAALSAAVPLGIETVVDEPVRTQDVVLNMLVAGAAGLVVHNSKTGQTVLKDKDFPQEELHTVLGRENFRVVREAEWRDDVLQGKPKVRVVREAVRDESGAVIQEPIMEIVDVPTTTRRTKVRDAEYELIPPELHGGHPVDVVQQAVETEAKKQGLGSRIAWTIHKEMSSFGTAGKRVADFLFDDVSDYTKNSLESVRSPIRTELMMLQAKAEDLTRQAMREDGHGFLKRMNPFSAKAAAQHQRSIEDAIAAESNRRLQLHRQGRAITYDGVEPRIKAIVDARDAAHFKAVDVLKAAGVEGAETLEKIPGWHHRAWSPLGIENIQNKFKALGKTQKEAHQATVRIVSRSLKSANAWGDELSYDVAASIVNRAIRKGNLEDAAFVVPAGEGQLKWLRDLLEAEKIPHERIERLLSPLKQAKNDAGKASFMKHRVDLDYSTGEFVNGEFITVASMLDNRVTSTIQTYMDGVATQAALAHKGVRKMSDIDKLRSELIEGTPMHQRQKAAELFDQSVNSFMGRPTGARMNDALRLTQAYGRAITLGMSGTWQIGEYHTMMARYGALKTWKYMLREMPGIKPMLGEISTATGAKKFLDIMQFHSEQSTRLRPYLHLFEDNYVIGTDQTLQMAAQQMGQAVPYMNAMKWIHSNQARVASNLILDSIESAVKGNAKSREMLKRYGIDLHAFGKLEASVKKFGYDVDKWDDGAWEATRPAFAKMMDEAVLHSRMGDMPSFATLDPVGKFILTYRSFTVASHNKLLAGGLDREGLGATSLMLAYQVPLALLTTQSASVLRGEGLLEDKELAKKAMGQLSTLGLFTEVSKIVTGDMSSLGSPGLIPIDRGIRAAGSVSSAMFGDGNLNQVGNATAALVPLINATPWFKGAMKNLTED